MISTDVSGNDGRVEESTHSNPSSMHISSSQRGLVTDEDPQKRFQGGSLSVPKRLQFLNFGNLSSPSAKFQQIAEEKDEISRSVPSSGSVRLRERLNRLFSRKIDWASLSKITKEWIRDPLNMALLVWAACVAVSGAILFLVMTGMLNRAIPKKYQRDVWFEVNNQILNALFTLMCLYAHPKRLYHFVLLVRWRPEDVSRLRKAYCKDGTYKPNEWTHMMVVVLLLNLNCFAQYALCGLNLGYKRSQRPAVGVGLCISIAIGAPAIAGIYSMLSPLGKDYTHGQTPEMDEEAQLQPKGKLRKESLEKRFSFASGDGRDVETTPQWSGGILDFWNDISTAYLSLFCTFCVFGWNMERLGLGNMYVHIATFLLFCMAPFWIFNLAAVNIDNDSVRGALGVTGIFLCLFGLLYGGFWRIQMRRRYNLPAYNFPCGKCKSSVADCALWMFCCWCSLAQEVRTGNSYDIVEDKFYRKQPDNGPISPLPREDGVFKSSPSSSTPHGPVHVQPMMSTTPSPSRFSLERDSPDASNVGGKNNPMTPPAPEAIQREDV
ncbi:unnamed protein product [Cuscuta epithymum]|uniref:PLAC8 motif-containing protein n=1 Tax=Cuscuta epithymum TaxID=186058 RepID=A0AAV0DHP0_9ASTE|nr:unnamed protein product [Cuscuta epithymum]